MTINKRELLFLGACFIWIPPFYLPTALAVVVRCALIAAVFFTQEIKKNPLLIMTIVYIGLILGSTFVFDYGMSNLIRTIAPMSVLLGCVICASNPSNGKALVNGLRKGLLLYFVIDLYFIFVANGIGINGDGQPVFFSGGKFNVCYMYLLMSMLLFLKHKYLKVYHQFFIIVFGMFMAKYVDCSTGLLGIMAFYGVMLLPSWMKKGKRIYVWLAGMIYVHYLIVFVQIQSTSRLLTYIVTDLLHKQIHLTGRTRIYNKFGEIMEGHWLFGHGYTSDKIVEATKLANTQNGFLQAIYNGGIVAFVLFMLILIYIFYRINQIEAERERNILFSAMIAFLVIAIVEIPFTSVVFYFLMSIIYVYSWKGKGEKHV